MKTVPTKKRLLVPIFILEAFYELEIKRPGEMKTICSHSCWKFSKDSTLHKDQANAWVLHELN